MLKYGSGIFNKVIIIMVVLIFINYPITYISSAKSLTVSAGCDGERHDEIILLISQLSSGDYLTSKEAARDLGGFLDCPKVVFALMKYLDQDYYPLNLIAENVLYDTPEINIHLLIAGLSDKNITGGITAVLALIPEPQDEETIKIILESTRDIIKLLKYDDKHIQYSCCLFLFRWGDHGIDASSELSGLLQSEEQYIRNFAASTILTLGYRNETIFNELLNSMINYQDFNGSSWLLRAAAYLAPVPDNYENILIEYYTNGDPRLSIWAAATLILSNSINEEYLDTIVSELYNEDFKVQFRAAEALGLIGPAAEGALCKLESLLDQGWSSSQRKIILDAIENIKRTEGE